MKAYLSEYIVYLEEQVGEPYLWGGQHTKLTPDNYISVITRKEEDEEYRAQSIEFCRKKFEAGAKVLYAYDCSGLGMYWLENLKRIYKNDMTANSMMAQCEEVSKPKKGYWVFRVDSTGTATHIGFMVSDTEVVHAKGRAYGVVKVKYSKSFWHRAGKPKCFDFEDDPPEPQPEPPEPMLKYVQVKRKCRVRAGNGTKNSETGKENKTLKIARVGERFPLVGQDEHDPYWYIVEWDGKQGWITNNTRYTEAIGV